MSWTDDDVVPQQGWTDADVAPEPPVGQGLNKIGRVLIQAMASPAVLASKGAHKLASATGHGDKVADLGPLLDEYLDKFAPHQGFIEDIAKSAPAIALPGGWIPQVAGNAAIGAVEANKGEELSGAGKGAAFGTAGKVLSKALGGLITPTNEARTLMDRGVALTPGQAAGPGTLANRAENWLASNPVSAVPIRGAQRRGVEEANRAAAESVAGVVEHGKKLGLPPREAIEQTREVISKHYDSALEGMAAPTDGVRRHLADSFQTLVAEHPMMPAESFKQMRQYVANRFDNLMANGAQTLDGAMLKQIDSEIGQQIRRLQSSANAADKTAAPAWKDLQQSLREAMEVGANSPQQYQALKQANTAYRQLLALEKALLPGSDVFTPRRLNMTLEKAGIKGTDLNNVAGAMSKTLPNTVPDSGTVERLIANMLPTMLMGGGYGANELGYGTLGAGLVAAGALGSRPGARFMTGGLPRQQMLAAALRRTTPAVGHAATRKDDKK